MKLFRLFFLWFSLLPFLAPAQELRFKTQSFEYQNEPLKVNKLFQDRVGFIWLGTDQGLFRFDGLTPKPVIPQNSNTIAPVTALYQDRQNRLWVGCETGQIFQYNYRTSQLVAFAPEEGLPAKSITAFQEDNTGNLWLSTYGEGLYIWQNQRLYNLNSDDGLPDNAAYNLILDPQGHIWTGTDRGIGICTFRNGKKRVKTLGLENGLPDNIVTALALSLDKNSVWAGTYSGGFCRVNLQDLSVEVPPMAANWAYGVVSRLEPQVSGCLIGTKGQGVWEFSAEKEQRLFRLSEEPEVRNLKVTDLLTDKEGLLWVASNAPQVSSANLALRFLPLPGSPSESGIHSVLADKNGNIWYSTDQGLFCARKQPNGYQHKPRFPELPLAKYKVISLFQDGNGLLWVGTFGDGLYQIQPETGQTRHFTEATGLINNNVLSITGTGSEIWLATLGGASRGRLSAHSNDWRFEHFNQRDGIGFNYIYQVFIDSKEQVWFATDGKGLTRLAKGAFTNFTEKEGLPARTIYSVAETRDGTIWVATPKDGLYRLSGNRFEKIAPEKIFGAQNITSLLADGLGNLAVVHRNGLEVLQISDHTFRHFGPEQGLETGEPNLNAVSLGPEKTVWIGGQKVLIGFRTPPGKVVAVPQTRLTSVQLFLKPILPDQPHEFSYDENHITFEYAGLWYQNPEEVSYRLKLEGYDREWTVSNNRSITYPKLPPGNYRFKVVASATGNFEGLPEVSYTFTVRKPFWSTFWFYGLVLSGAAASLYGYVKNREKRVKKAERLEKDKVMFQFETLKNQVNPHFLFNSFNTLIGLIEDDQEMAVEYVEKLSDFFRDILVYREKDTISLAEELVLIRNYYFLQQKRYGSSLHLNIDVPETSLNLEVPPLTLQLLVENAIKHNVISRDKPLFVTISVEEGPGLAVRNNLQPKKSPERSTGIGLENIRKRYAILGTRPVLITKTETEFEVKVPLFTPKAL